MASLGDNPAPVRDLLYAAQAQRGPVAGGD